MAASLCLLALAGAGCGGGGGNTVAKDAAGVRASYADFWRLARDGESAAACRKYLSARTRRGLNAYGGCALVFARLRRLIPKDVGAGDLDVWVSGDRARYRAPDESGTAIYSDGHWVFDGGAPVRAESSASTTITMRTPERLVEQGGEALAAYTAGKQIAPQAGCLACHKIGKDGSDGPGAPLTHIGALRTRQAIVRALISPRRPMPSFRELQRTQPEKFNNLVEFLSQLK